MCEGGCARMCVRACVCFVKETDADKMIRDAVEERSVL